jgi:hypothetical protein
MNASYLTLCPRSLRLIFSWQGPHNEKKIMTTTTVEAKLSAMRTIRAAWFDESLDAQARGDATAAAEAKRNVDACDVQIRRIEKQIEPSRSSYPATIRSALGMLRMRA